MGIAEGIIAAAAVAGAGASIAGAAGGGGGGGGGASTGRTNPASGFIDQLFGVRWTPSGYKRDIFAKNDLFGNDEKQKIKDLLKGVPLDPGALASVDALLGRASSEAPSWLDKMSQAVDYAKSAADTGFRTDVAPVAAQRKWDLMNNVVPALAEKYAGQTGTFGTDFISSLGHESTGMEYDLGALQTQLDESAAERRMRGISLFGQLAGTRAALPAALGSDILNLATSKRSAQSEARPGTDVLSVLATLGNIGNGGQIMQSGYRPTGNTADLISGISTAAPSIVSGVSDLFGTKGAGTGVTANPVQFQNTWANMTGAGFFGS